ncbi:MAG TPA: NAD(P)/FAD-dependent oxidoreductase [Nocardioides sp.]|nr:NAD(P)/FAD-dependent oxidoreductase [Nocardioides sp.]
MRIGVVGAGLAGLACAWTLHRHGHQVVVLEARDRVGGRTWSARLPNGVVVERGGEWIDADQHTIRRFCAELHLPLAPHGVRFHRRTVDGATPTLAELEATLAEVETAIPEEDTTLAAAFEAALGPDYANDPTFLRIATSTAGDPHRASARLNVARAESGRIDGAARVVGGNQRIAEALAAGLGDRVRTGTPVAGIETGTDGAVLTTEHDERIEVDRVVVAVPLALLDDLDLEPALPDSWRSALAHVATGTAVKLSVPTTGAAAPRGVQHPGETWWAWNSLDPAGDGGVAAVTCFGGGTTARDALAVADGPATWLALLRDLRPDLDPTDEPLLTDWTVDPWSRGGYSHLLAGADPDALAVLQRRNGPLALAGEYTAGAGCSGTMEGALASGVRAAHALL